MNQRSAISALPAQADKEHHDEHKGLAALPAPSPSWLHPSDVLLPLAFGLWILGLTQVTITRLGPFGLPPDLPIAYFAAFGVFLISGTCELIGTRLTPWRMAVHAVTLVVMLYGTAPILYREGRYEWLYKTVGVVQYINAHGSLNPRIDIYQNWPGFFALAAWFDKVAGIGSPLAYAKWAQVIFELAALPLLYLIYSTLRLSIRQRWIAILLYSASNWIGQDYFSPQALGTVLTLGIMAFAMRWLYVGGSLAPQSPSADPIRQASRAGEPIGLAARARSLHFTPRAAAVLAILAIFIFLTITHQLSPYMVVEQLGVLALIGVLRPRWLPILLLAIALAYLIPRYSFVAANYGLTKSIGHFLSNLRPPSFSAPNVSSAQRLIQRGTEVLSVGVWALAGLGAWRNRRIGRPVLALLLLAYSPVTVLAFGSYGNEGILRVYLFSLAWSAALAAMVLAPSGSRVGTGQSRFLALTERVRRAARSLADALRVPARWMRPGAVRIPLTLGVVLALFFPSFFGDDGFNYMTTAEVRVATHFWLHARPGHVYLPIDAVPIGDTYRYNVFSWSPIFGSTLKQSAVPVTYTIASDLAQKARAKTHGFTPSYVMVTDNMVAFNKAYGITTPASFYILLDSLRRSRLWKLVLDSGGVIVYKLPACPAPVHVRDGRCFK